MIHVSRHLSRVSASAARRRANARGSQAVRGLTNLRLAVVKETLPAEQRVALVPKDVAALIKKGASVAVEKGAGAGAGVTDAMFSEAGASLVSKADAWKSDVVVKVLPPTEAEAAALGDRTIVANIAGRQNEALVGQLAAQGATVFDLSMLLRTLSRGQAFDVLSSQASIAGYRAVVEVANAMQRPFAGQSTAAGRIEPSRVLVVGAGVAGLAAIQAAKNMGAIVTAFDVRAAAAEQVESIGATFLKVEFEEAGDGAGGYAKEMSPEWFAAAEKTLLKECAKTNAIITTALIPGRQAPVLITRSMVEAMPYGGCTVDLAAEAGGNVETTVAGEVVTMPSNGVTCVGYTDLNSRMAATSSTMFSGNVSKFLVSMSRAVPAAADGAEASGTEEWHVDLENDEAVRSICSVHNGAPLEPYVPPPPPPLTPEQLEALAAKEEAAAAAALAAIVDPHAVAQRGAIMASGVAGVATVAATAVPAAGMASTFALSLWVGSAAVQNVSHALHSPLMSITNAISGMTIVGGMLQLGGGFSPETVPQYLAAGAVSLSAVNLVGGFLVTQKMLDMFRRPTDPEEFDHYYFAPPLLLGGGVGLAALGGAASPALISTVALASGLGCVGGISCLSQQSTARLGVTVGMGGVGLGLAATLATMSTMPEIGAGVYGQLAMFGGAGGAVGYGLASRIGPTQLPQAVAGFHCLVGLAATATAVGDFMVHDIAQMSNFHSTSLFLGAWMGAITTTGSIIACGKLAEILDSKPLQLPNRDYINMGLGGLSATSLLGFVATADPTLAALCLGTGIGSSGALGFHMTGSIGGADMPVVITLLNSYSGWALCAEGFILDQPVLTIVGALIGSSGAFLTKIMCDGMNRSLTNVILGGFGTESGAVQTAAGLEHTETSVEGSVQSLLDAERIAIVPGYGMAVAQAAPAVAEINSILTKMGKTVQFGVHPVAGRMPGQLNVLLAEAGVPYDNVVEMEEMNDELNAGNFDVAMVIGANDTVNSLAEEDPTCDIAGMPVIRVWESTEVIFMKRSMASGYAGVDNPVFYKDCTNMLLGDAKDTCEGIRTGLAAVEKE